jgi:hypothetical protein
VLVRGLEGSLPLPLLLCATLFQIPDSLLNANPPDRGRCLSEPEGVWLGVGASEVEADCALLSVLVSFSLWVLGKGGTSLFPTFSSSPDKFPLDPPHAILQGLGLVRGPALQFLFKPKDVVVFEGLWVNVEGLVDFRLLGRVAGSLGDDSGGGFDALRLLGLGATAVGGVVPQRFFDCTGPVTGEVEGEVEVALSATEVGMRTGGGAGYGAFEFATAPFPSMKVVVLLKLTSDILLR